MAPSTQRTKLSAILACFVLSLAATEAASSQTCSTKYVSTSTKVTSSTTSVTKTATVTVTSTNYQTETIEFPATTTTKTSFIYSDTTLWFTTAKTTTTVPTPKGFTPMASATTATGVRPQKRGPRGVKERATSSYPYQVVCTNYNTVTSTSTYVPNDIVATTTYTQTPRTMTSTRTFTTWRATTSTVSVATRTVHAVCAPSGDNVIDTFNARNINLWDTDGFKRMLGGAFSVPSDPDFATTRAAAQSPLDCCEAAVGLGLSGFQYYGSAGYSGSCVGSSGADVANFRVGPYAGTFGHVWCGNGPGGNPEFYGFYDSANGFS